MSTPWPQFSLKSLLLAAAAVPPVVWLAVDAGLKIWRRDPDDKFNLPDPILVMGIATWLGLYYHLIHKRLPAC